MDGVDGLHTVSNQEVAVRAYFLAQARGFLPGHELDDWLQAEAELRAERSRALPSAASDASFASPPLLPEPVQPPPDALALLPEVKRPAEGPFAAQAPRARPLSLDGAPTPYPQNGPARAPLPAAAAAGTVTEPGHSRPRAAPARAAAGGVRSLGGEPVLRAYGFAALLLALSVFQPGVGAYKRLFRTLRALLALLLLAQVASLALSRRPRRRTASPGPGLEARSRTAKGASSAEPACLPPRPGARSSSPGAPATLWPVSGPRSPGRRPSTPPCHPHA